MGFRLKIYKVGFNESPKYGFCLSIHKIVQSIYLLVFYL
jgi:hypothetical protein